MPRVFTESSKEFLYLMRPYYFVSRFYGPIFIPLAIVLTIILDRSELLAPLLIIGPGLVSFSVVWEMFKVKKSPVIIAGGKYFDASIKILPGGIVLSLFAAAFGAVLETGFSLIYTVLVLSATSLTMAGGVLIAIGIRFGRKELLLRERDDSSESANASKNAK